MATALFPSDHKSNQLSKKSMFLVWACNNTTMKSLYITRHAHHNPIFIMSWHTGFITNRKYHNETQQTLVGMPELN